MQRLVLFAMGLGIVVAMHIVEGGNFAMLVNWGAVLLCILTPLLLSLVIYRGDLVRALSAACGLSELDAASTPRFMEVVAGLRMLCLTMGGLAYLVGLVGAVGTLDKPSELGAWIALGLLAVVYTVVLSELCLVPLMDRLAGRGVLAGSELPGTAAGASKRAFLTDLAVLALATCSVLGVAALVGDQAGHFLQPAALGIILAFGPLNAAFHGVAGHHRAFMAGYSPAEYAAGERAQHQLVLNSARDIIYALGTVGVIIGLIHVLSALDDPNKIGQGLAICLVAPLYAVAVAELFVAPRIRCLAAGDSPPSAELKAVMEAAGSNRAPWRGSLLAIGGGMLLFVLCLHAV